MGNVPLIASAAKVRWGNRLGPIELETFDELGYGRKGFAPVARCGPRGRRYGVTREMQDEWALGASEELPSPERGKFQVGEELMRIEIPQKKAPIVLESTSRPGKT